MGDSGIADSIRKKEITEDWIKKANGIIHGMEGGYREGSVYVESIVETAYYPEKRVCIQRIQT